MSYTPTNWKTGDVVTSAKLNKLENGVADAGGGGVLVVHDTDGTLDKTWQEIHDASTAIIADTTMGLRLYLSAAINPTDGVFSCFFFTPGDSGLTEVIYTAASADGFPQEQSLPAG